MRINDDFDNLVMVPGPTPVHREILHAIAEPTLWHASAPMARIVRVCQDGVLSAAGSESGRAFIFGGSGTLAQEAAVVNLVAPGERVLVASNGFFGDRFARIAEAYGIEVDALAALWGSSVTADDVERRLSQGHYRAITITHVDTSTGTAAPIAELVNVAHKHDTLVIVDSVCALGGMAVDMDLLGIDIVLSGAQKALGVPPGLVILAVSQRALERRRAMGRVPAFYADLLNWEASMKDPQTYFSTHAVNLFYALQAGLAIIEREGLTARFERHVRLATAFRAGMAALGLRPVTDERFLAPTLSVLSYPDGINDDTFRAGLVARGIVAAPSMKEFKGVSLRFGHMGNISESDILQTVAAAEATLHDMGQSINVGAGVAAVRRELTEEITVGVR